MSYHGYSSGSSTTAPAGQQAITGVTTEQRDSGYNVAVQTNTTGILPEAPYGTHYMANGDLMTGSSAELLHEEMSTSLGITEVIPKNGAVNINDKNARSGTRRAAQTALYSDIPLNFRVHPTLYDVRPLKDLDAVRQSVKNLVLSNFTDRPFQPNLGGNITGLLFEPPDIGTAVALREEIKRMLDEHEPRITNIKVSINDNRDANAYEVTIQYLIIIADTDDEVEFYLERLR